MHDALKRYDPDYSEPAAEMPVRSRTSTDGALTMQVLTDGAYHRRTPNLSHTACGLVIQTQYSPLRREELAGMLCRSCFTAFELAIADKTNAERNHDNR